MRSMREVCSPPWPGLVLALAGCAPGCPSTPVDPSESGGQEDTAQVDTGPEDWVWVEWTDTALVLHINGGPGGYWFGLAQTTGACGDWCWTAEDCLYGFVDPDSGEMWGPYCHEIGDAAQTQLSFGGDCGALPPGQTCLQDNALADGLGFFLESSQAAGGTGDCWIWGHQAEEYYGGLGCTEL